ncbi:MAG: transposase, partial [Candidatus Nitrosopolaris sp.]
EKWIRKKKEFIKLHIAVDTKSKKVVSFRITRGNVHDAKMFCPKENHLRNIILTKYIHMIYLSISEERSFI